MSTEVTDLDIFVPENKNVKLGGVQYVLPGDLPMEVFLRLNAAGTAPDGEEADGAKTLEALLGVMGDLYAWVAPEDQKPSIKAKVESVLRGRGVKFLMDMVSNVYKEDDVAPVEDDTPPTPAPEAGTTST